jgi:large subunit ribosomal protein L32e
VEALDALKARRRKRKAISRKKDVEFKRYLSWEFWKFERRGSWRKPKGKDNKMRMEIKGYPPRVKVGYRNEASIRGLHPSGLKPVVISNPKDLEGLDPRAHIVYISSTVGLRRGMELVRLALEKGFKVVGRRAGL